MRRRPDGRRMNGRDKALGDAFARIFPERASFELRDDDVEALRKHLEMGGQVSNIQAFQQFQRDKAETAAWKEKHPCLLQSFSQFFARAQNKRIAVFLDYDGTLTPIVKDPDCAFMSSEMRGAVKSVACLFPTAIISGRGREKVEDFVKLKELFYAGSHGMDIVGPEVNDGAKRMSFQAAERFGPVMDIVFEELKSRVAEIKGASVEHNKFCVSVHFRNCEEDVYEDVIEVVNAVLLTHKDLKATRGRKVMEIRPEVEWNKGHALSHLLQSLSLSTSSDVLPIYIGDDRTDEDAFSVLREDSKGVGILVSTKVKETMATYRVRDPAEVCVFLDRLVSWGRGEDNAWHRDGSCRGWKLNLEQLPDPTANSSSQPLRANSTSDPAHGRPPIHPKTSLPDRSFSQDLANQPSPREPQSLLIASGQDVIASVNIDAYQNLVPSPFEGDISKHWQEDHKGGSA